MRLTRIPLIASLLFLCALPGTTQSSLRSDILFMLPEETGEVGFLDLRQLRRSPHFGQIRQKLMPEQFGPYETFLRGVGINLDTDVDWLAWALVPPGQVGSSELSMAVAQGRFDPSQIDRVFTERGYPVHSYRGQTLFSFGAGEGSQEIVFGFLDSTTALFGARASVDLLFETRFGSHGNLQSNRNLSRRINEVNGRTPIWVVMDSYYTPLAVQQLVPEASKFPEFAQIAERFESSLLNMDIGRDVSLNFLAWCQQAVDAQSFSLLLQTGLVAHSWQVQGSNPELAAVMQRADVRSSGERLQVSLEVRESEARALLSRPLPGAF